MVIDSENTKSSIRIAPTEMEKLQKWKMKNMHLASSWSDKQTTQSVCPAVTHLTW